MHSATESATFAGHSVSEEFTFACLQAVFCLARR